MGQKTVKSITVKNAMGLHARPATAIAKLLQTSQSEVSLTYEQETVDARSMLSILALAIKKNMQIILTAEGVDAEETMQRLVEAFEGGFGERID